MNEYAQYITNQSVNDNDAVDGGVPLLLVDYLRLLHWPHPAFNWIKAIMIGHCQIRNEQ